MTAAQRETQQVSTYKELLAITEEVLANTRRTLKATAQYRPKNSRDMIEGLHKDLTECCAVGERVVDQARRRVVYGEQVPGSEKIYSIFEPHTDLIKRGKVSISPTSAHAFSRKFTSLMRLQLFSIFSIRR